MNEPHPRTRVLLIGGTGVFGSRLATGLRKQPGVVVRVAGRGADNDVRLDCDAPDLAARIAAEEPDIVIDAAGPFQTYGDDPYRVARAAIGIRAHYLDLSDDAGFTTGIAALDGAAKDAGVALLSGVSTVPAISSAAVEALSDGLDDIHLIDSFIVPGNRAPRGLAVMRAILAQAGQRMNVWRAGRDETVRGWGRLRRVDLPGLGRRWVSVIGAPDLTLFPTRYRARSVTFGAGLELWFMHLGLWAMALPVRWGLVPSLAPVARPMRWVAGLFERMGTDRGGMRTRVVGSGPAGTDIRDWTVIAEAGDGPHIPALPGRVMVAKLIAGDVAPGARACVGAFTLAELEAMSTDLALTYERRDTPFVPVFRQALGASFDGLPAAVRDLHDVLAYRRWSGTARVDRGTGLRSRLICAIVGFPHATPDTDVTVTMERRDGTEIWIRDFGGKRFRSHLQSVGTPGDGVVTERFGPLTFRIGLTVVDGALTYPVLSGRCGPLPIPAWLLPRSETTEAADGDAATFDVKVSLPGAGLLVRYRGRLTPDG
ncbi:SDR family oxidoreductase [Jannaschia donghaensis]|uniref:Saccharopine dehydrogenase n=1 Tax=Jannaschia donghaensis TaxID=420998 RepID=A0A0M6YD75_9RHOB|nr:SDR family oxidoreductase [Jannaschia donghaensis]CTQ48311.1 Saccharopine dehydrogenase [Jannaschia donghaensis]